MGVSAINTGNNLIYLILAVLLGVLAISGFFGKENLTGVRMDIRIPDEIYAGIPVPISVIAQNPGRLFPIFLIRAYVGDTLVLFPYIRAGTTDQRLTESIFPRRGEQTIDEIRIASVYPFSFFIRYKTVSRNCRFTVFPHPIPFRGAANAEWNRRNRGEQYREQKGYEGDILSIRDYLKGDSIRYINWKASARTGSLKTNELSAGLAEPLLIDFDQIQIPDPELKLSCLTSLVRDCFRGNKAVGLKMRGRLFPPASTREQKLLLLRELARYGEKDMNDGR